MPSRPRRSGRSRYASADQTAEALAGLQAAWQRLAPGRPFEYTFVDDRYAEMYLSERRLATIASVFAALAIFVACLGLFGLVAFTARQRTKEIGIRKVLGASVASVVALLSKDLVRLVVVAFVVAAPVGWLLMNRWLESFAYHAEIGLGVFAVVGLLALAVTLATVSTQALRAATADPVKALRYE